METLPFQQYKNRLDGSGRIIVQNHKHIKPCHIINPTIIPSADTTLPLHTMTIPNTTPLEQPPEQPNPNTTHENLIEPAPSKIPRALKNIADHNAPGLLEQHPLPPLRGNSL